MDKETKIEIALRTLRLDSVGRRWAQIDAARLAFIDELGRTHETIQGRRVRLTKQRKVSRFNAKIDRIFSEDFDVSKDAINQVKALDRNA